MADADLDDGAGGFVAEDARWGDGAVLDFFDIGRADAAGGNFDEEFVTANARDGNSLDLQIIRAAINGGAHGFGNGDHRMILTMDGHG